MRETLEVIWKMDWDIERVRFANSGDALEASLENPVGWASRSLRSLKDIVVDFSSSLWMGKGVCCCVRPGRRVIERVGTPVRRL